MNFNNVEITSGGQNKYLTTGVEVIKVTEVKSGLSSAKQSPFIEITVSNDAGAVATGQFYLNDGAFNISANTFFKFIGAAYKLNIDNEGDKAIIKGKIGEVADKEALAAKLATVLVGRQFAMLLKGEWVHPQDTAKKSFIKTVLSNIVAPADKAGTLKFDSSKHIKGEEAPAAQPNRVIGSTTEWA
jgi:hypothetical protein